MGRYLELARKTLAAVPAKRQARSQGYDINDGNDQSPPWDPAEAERLLAELRSMVARARQEHAGSLTDSVGRVASDLLVVAERYAANHEEEAARGWDAMELLRGVQPTLRPVLQRGKGKDG